MKITKIETIRPKATLQVHAGQINWLWVRIHTDEGIAGIGETYPRSDFEESVIHGEGGLARRLLGKDPRQIDRLWADMMLDVSFHGWAGAEMRAISAIDTALWDILGKISGQPIYQLLGGKCRDEIRIYNTCYGDPYDFNTDADKLAKHLYAQGIKAMKIWNFDATALKNDGQFITPRELEENLAPIKKIRDALGIDMEVMMEFHGYWNLPCAIKIAQALEPFQPTWLEEMLPQDNLDAYAILAKETTLPLCLTERLMTRWQMRPLMDKGIARIIMPDTCWTGGISETKKIASMAEAYYLPVAPHNCGGPVLHVATSHIAANLRNLFILETVQKFYTDVFPAMLTNLPEIKDGKLKPLAGPGLGTDLREEVVKEAEIRISS